MPTRIRLRRVGRNKQGSFRIVVADSVHARGGRITETIGKYNPRTQPSYIEVDEGRALHWLRQGAQMSDSVGALFRKVGILKKFADGADGEGVVTLGDPQGKTRVVTGPPAASAPVAPALRVKEKPAKPEAKPAAEAEVQSAAEAEIEPAAEAEAKAEAEAEAADAEAAAEKQGEGS